MTGDHELHTLAGPYAMDAVTPQERSSFARHLADCAQCRDDVREMREAAARLGMAAVVRPRPELKEQTMKAAFRTSQLAPMVGEPVPRRWRWAWRDRPVRLSAKFALACAALVAVGVTWFGLAANNMMEQLRLAARQDHMIATVLNARDAVMLTARVTTGGTATVVMSHHEHRLVFTAHGLRALANGRGYELWLMGPAGDRPAGMLKLERGGMSEPTVVSGLGRGDVIGVTVEPASGSRLPSSTIVLLIWPR